MRKIILKSLPRKTTIKRSVVRKMFADLFGKKTTSPANKRAKKASGTSLGRKKKAA
jgi:hypothetical protein